MKIPVPCFWNLNRLKDLLVDYHDKIVVEFLKYGWPVNHDGRKYNSKKIENWKGAITNKKQVQKYLENELKFKSVIGPFDSNPFCQEAGISPLNTRDKKDSEDKRVILDLSFPEGFAVNEGIDKLHYLGVEIEWQLPTVDTLIAIMIRKGIGSLLFKRDLKRYYRQIFLDPVDAPKLGYYIDDTVFFDCTLPMGMTSSCYIAQRVSSIIPFIMQQRGYSIVNYIDDLGGADSPNKAMQAFNELGKLLKEIGILESEAKATPPSTKMLFLGILLDSVKQTVSIDVDRLKEIRNLTKSWLGKSSASLKELQSLIGVLSFAASCVREGRLFFSRLLILLKETKGKVVHLNEEALKDVAWWHAFAKDFNGTSVIPSEIWCKPDAIFSSDSCLTGCGAISHSKYLHFEIPETIIKEGKYINQFEMYAVLIAVREWRFDFEDLNLLIYCDNSSTVQALQSGRISCPFMQKCLREIRFYSAKLNFRVRAVHLPGVLNRKADFLSRWHISDNYKKLFEKEIEGQKLTETIVTKFEINEFW